MQLAQIKHLRVSVNRAANNLNFFGTLPSLPGGEKVTDVLPASSVANSISHPQEHWTAELKPWTKGKTLNTSTQRTASWVQTIPWQRISLQVRKLSEEFISGKNYIAFSMHGSHVQQHNEQMCVHSTTTHFNTHVMPTIKGKLERYCWRNNLYPIFLFSLQLRTLGLIPELLISSSLDCA
jgi:hypothetical protein